MAFKLEAFQNRHLAQGQSRIDAILTVTADATLASGAGGPLVVGFIVDKSGSMDGARMDSVRRAVTRGIALLPASSWFFVVAFDAQATIVVPPMQATDANKRRAGDSVAALHALGGTAMSKGLAEARALFAQAPNAIHQAIFLTDGKNESDTSGAVAAELRACEGLFQCDCWGVGTDWRVGEVQEIARELLGKASLIPEPEGVEAAFRGAIEKASSKALKDVRLRLWTPVGAKLAFVKQVNPTIEDLTAKEHVVSPQVRDFMTGAWAADESREFHVAIDVKPGAVNDEMLAARPSVVFLESDASGWNEREDKAPGARIFATWTGDDSLSSRIDGHVAHYTGQGELATAIAEGLELREHGKNAEATQMLGRAVKIAHDSGNVETTQRLKRVVDIVDASQGTVVLKRSVEKAAAMDLQLESRTTKRVARKAADS